MPTQPQNMEDGRWAPWGIANHQSSIINQQ